MGWWPSSRRSSASSRSSAASLSPATRSRTSAPSAAPARSWSGSARSRVRRRRPGRLRRRWSCSACARPRARDVATGIVLGAALGLAALFLYWDTTVRSTTGATVTVLFGSLFAISRGVVPALAILSAASLAGIVVLYRPLLLSSLDPDMAAARGVPVRTVGVGFLLVLAVAVSMSSVVVGAILEHRPAHRAGGHRVAVDEAARPGDGRRRRDRGGGDVARGPPRLRQLLLAAVAPGWPVSFFVVALVFVLYVVVTSPARAAPPGRYRTGQSYAPSGRPGHVLRLDGQRLGGGDDRRRRRRRHRLLRRRPWRGVRRPCHPAVRLRRCGWGRPPRRRHVVGLGVFSLVGALAIGWLGRRGRARRRHRAGPRHDAWARRALL